MLLSLPCSTWVTFRFYRTTIQIPRERADFEKQEADILAAIRTFQADHNVPPERLSDLVPDYLRLSSLEDDNWSFQYGRDDDVRFALSSEVPSYWFGWPARRVCNSESEESVSCSYHYVCGFKMAATYLTDPISPDEAQQKPLAINQTNPCTSSQSK